MIKYLIDVNLPYYFKLWNTDEYVHQIDLNPEASDKEIWDFAKREKLTIVTKDSDFSNRILISNPPPNVIHIKFGNMKMSEFHLFLNEIWEEAVKMSKEYKLVNIFKGGIEGID